MGELKKERGGTDGEGDNKVQSHKGRINTLTIVHFYLHLTSAFTNVHVEMNNITFITFTRPKATLVIYSCTCLNSIRLNGA